jgi:hypothetical protein
MNFIKNTRVFDQNIIFSKFFKIRLDEKIKKCYTWYMGGISEGWIVSLPPGRRRPAKFQKFPI